MAGKVTHEMQKKNHQEKLGTPLLIPENAVYKTGVDADKLAGLILKGLSHFVIFLYFCSVKNGRDLKINIWVRGIALLFSKKYELESVSGPDFEIICFCTG